MGRSLPFCSMQNLLTGSHRDPTRSVTSSCVKRPSHHPFSAASLTLISKSSAACLSLPELLAYLLLQASCSISSVSVKVASLGWYLKTAVAGALPVILKPTHKSSHGVGGLCAPSLRYSSSDDLEPPLDTAKAHSHHSRCVCVLLPSCPLPSRRLLSSFSLGLFVCWCLCCPAPCAFLVPSLRRRRLLPCSLCFCVFGCVFLA